MFSYVNKNFYIENINYNYYNHFIFIFLKGFFMKTLIQRKITPAIFLSFICVANAASDRQPISNEDAFKIVREEIRINAAKKFLETRKNEAKMKELLARPEDDDFNLDSNPTSPISQHKNH